ncbi:MAG: hypothetical protein OHK0029_23040 [Armatimonadaceae bacterium]
MRLSRTRIVLTLLLLTFSCAAHAQFTYTNPFTSRTFNNPVSSSLDTLIQQKMQRRALTRSLLKKKGYSESELNRILEMPEAERQKYLDRKLPVSSAPAAAKPAAVPATRFKPAQKRLLLNTIADSLGQTDKQKKVFQQVFAQLATAYESEAKRLGFPHDIAGAMAFLTEVSYALYNPEASERNDAETQALVRQFRTLLDSDALRKAPDAERQKLYEYFLGMGAYLYTLSEAAADQHDMNAAAAVVRLGGESLRELFQVEPDRVRLTKTGLEITPAKP